MSTSAWISSSPGELKNKKEEAVDWVYLNEEQMRTELKWSQEKIDKIKADR